MWPHNRHRLQGIIEVRPAIAADFVASTLNGEDPAQVLMVTSKCKLQCLSQWANKPVPSRKLVARIHFISPIFRITFQFSSARSCTVEASNLTIHGDSNHDFVSRITAQICRNATSWLQPHAVMAKTLAHSAPL